MKITSFIGFCDIDGSTGHFDISNRPRVNFLHVEYILGEIVAFKKIPGETLIFRIHSL